MAFAVTFSREVQSGWVGCDLVSSHGIEQCLEEVLTMMTATCFGKRDERLEGLECLQRAFEAQRPRLDIVFLCSVSHGRSSQVVRQQVCPDFLADQVGNPASHDIHLHRRFD